MAPIRDTMPTTERRLPFGPNALPTVLTELDRLTYLFYGRTLDDFESDQRRWRGLGWPFSLAGWIVATPGPHDWPSLDAELAESPIMLWCHNQYPGWDARVHLHGDALFSALATLRVYFGQIVFSRGEWAPIGERLRREVLDLSGGSDPASIGPWFNGGYCRSPLYLLRFLNPNAPPATLKGPLPVPEEIARCGRHDSPTTDGIPIEWLHSLEHHASKLAAAVHAQSIAANHSASEDRTSAQAADVEKQHQWTLIIGASRQLLKALRNAMATLHEGIDPAATDVDFLLASAIRHEVGNLTSSVNWWFTRDPNSDGLHWADNNTAAGLWTCYQGQNQLRTAAIRLWRFYYSKLIPCPDSVLPRLTDFELQAFNSAIGALADAAGVHSMPQESNMTADGDDGDMASKTHKTVSTAPSQTITVAAAKTLVDVLRPRFDEVSRKYHESPLSVVLVQFAGHLQLDDALAMCPYRLTSKPRSVKPGAASWMHSVGSYEPLRMSSSAEHLASLVFSDGGFGRLQRISLDCRGSS